MPARRTLALVYKQESMERLPPDSSVLPLHPAVGVGKMRQVRRRPEDLLEESDATAIEKVVEDIVTTWWQDPSHADAFAWRGVNLADCFSYGLWLIVRDMVKAAWVLKRLLEEETPSALWTDVPVMDATVPPYPYMAAVGSLLQSLGKDLGIPYRNLAPAPEARQSPLRPSLNRLYGILASLRASGLLRRGRPLVAIGPHREFYQPLARAWRAMGWSSVVLTPSHSLIRAAPQAGLFVLPIESLLGRKEGKEVLNFRVSALQALRMMQLQGALNQGGIKLAPLLRTYLNDRFAREFEYLAALGVGFDGNLRRARHVVLIETESSLSKAALRYARQSGVPVTVLQHGVLASPVIYRRTEGERVAAWGPSDAQWFRDNLGRIVEAEATGCPRYDTLLDGDLSGPHLPRSQIPRVLFASQPFVQDRALASPWEGFANYTMVLEAARRTSDWALLIKWHPSQEPWRLPPVENQLEPRVLQFHKENTWALIRSSQVVLTLASTVALEAMYLDRPVVFLGPPDPESPFRPPEMGGGLRAIAQEELSRIVERLLVDDSYRERVLEGQRAFLADHYAPLDGRASERVVTFLERAER